MKQHTISVLVENQFGVLARISGLFSARGYNIDSLCVGVTDDPSISRMTVVVSGDDNVLAQIINQLNKLVEVIEVIDLTKTEFDLLELLMANAEIVVERDVIYERIWGFDFATSSNSLDVYIGYLRRKTEDGGRPRLVQTVRGVGYVLRNE